MRLSAEPLMAKMSCWILILMISGTLSCREGPSCCSNLTYSDLRYAVILAMAYVMLPLHTIKLLLLTRDSELS